MTNTSAILAIAASWLGTAGGGVTLFIKTVKKYEAEAIKYLNEIDNLVNEVQALTDQVTKAIPAPAPAPAKAVAKKAPAKRNLR